MASTYLTHTMSTPTARTKSTFSAWLKKTSAGANSTIFGGGNAATDCAFLNFNTSDKLFLQSATSDSADWSLTTEAVFRDPSAWYHVVAKIDTTQSTSSDRVKIYVNGNLQTVTGSYPSQNYDMQWSRNGEVQLVGKYPSTGIYFDGLMAHVHFTDGYAYDASTFGETDSTSGIWIPKTNPSVTYGTNGFFLKFENSGAMGTDSSGQSNTFTVGAGTLTQNIDTSTNNFATLNPLHKGSTLTGYTFANGNNTITFGSTSYPYTFSTQAVSSGKWYAEFKAAANATTVGIGISAGENDGTYFSHSQYDYAYYGYNGNIQSNQQASPAGYGSALSNNDILGVAMDLDNNKLYFSINGTFQNSGVPTSGSTGTGAKSISAPSSTPTGVYHFSVGDQNTQAGSVQCNFGSGFFGTTAVASANADGNGFGEFEYSVPTGYYALCTKNIKEFG